MKKTEELEAFNTIKELIQRANVSFDEKEANLCLEAAEKYFQAKYNDDLTDVNIIKDFEQLKNRRIMELGPFERDDAIISTAYEDTISNPGRAIELFLSAKNKEEFVSLDHFFIGYDREKNFNSFVRCTFHSICEENPLDALEKNAIEDNKGFTALFKKNMETVYREVQEEFKKKLIQSVVLHAGFLQELGSLDDMFTKQNDAYARTRMFSLKGDEYSTSGLMILALSDDEKKNVYSPEYLNDCNIMQLEAILSFLINRGEKVFDRIATGIYMFYVNTVETGSEEAVHDGEFLKKMWQKKTVLTEIFRTFIKNNSEKFEEIQGKTGGTYSRIGEEEVISFLESYAGAYSLFFPGSDIFDDYHQFDKILGAGISSRYNGKDKLIESLIIYSDKTRSNWGFTKEDDRTYKDRILLSFDIPGLNMPLRLHADSSKIANLMTNFFNTSEIPVYCGDEDFIAYGNNVGTQALYYVPTSKFNGLKKVIDKKRVPEGYANLANHIKVLQLDNSRKRLLKQKLGREVPDYYDVLTGKIISPSALNLSNISRATKKRHENKK